MCKAFIKLRVKLCRAFVKLLQGSVQLYKSSIHNSPLFHKALVELFVEICTDNYIGDSRAVSRAVSGAVVELFVEPL